MSGQVEIYGTLVQDRRTGSGELPSSQVRVEAGQSHPARNVKENIEFSERESKSKDASPQ